MGQRLIGSDQLERVGYLLPRLLVASVLAALLARPLAVLELDDASARSLGSPSST